MFDIMFMRQKQNETHATHLNRVSRTVYPLGLQFKLPRGTSSLEQARSILSGAAQNGQCKTSKYRESLSKA